MKYVNTFNFWKRILQKSEVIYLDKYLIHAIPYNEYTKVNFGDDECFVSLTIWLFTIMITENAKMKILDCENYNVGKSQNINLVNFVSCILMKQKITILTVQENSPWVMMGLYMEDVAENI